MTMRYCRSVKDSKIVGEMLHMRNVMGMSNGEIAEKIGCSDQSVRNAIGPHPDRKRRARKKKEIKLIEDMGDHESIIPKDSPVVDVGMTEVYRFLRDQLNKSINSGSPIRRIFGKAFDLSTERGRCEYAETIIPFLSYLKSSERESVINELTVATGVNIRSRLREIESCDDIVHCRDCIKFHTAGCPMANNVEQLIMLSNMFDDDRLMNYALNRHCSEGEREDK